MSSFTVPTDAALYRPLFSPWLGAGEFQRYFNIAAPRTLVSADRCYVLYTLLRQAIHLQGDIWECGVYRGGTAAMMAALIADIAPSKRIYLFDTFEGMPETDAQKDLHQKGDFSDTSLDAVKAYVGHPELTVLRQGFIPDTFAGLESASIAFAHIDVDIYQSVLDCTRFIWPRLAVGGFVIFDDYGFPTCPGARSAVDEFFNSQRCKPLCLPTGQALVFKSVA
jgi:O-methyltransferase